MYKIRIIGGNPLAGEIAISGAKNAVLPELAACLLTNEEIVLSNVPDLEDVTTMANLLSQHGVRIAFSGASSVDGSKNRIARLQADNIHNFEAPHEIMCKMRNSIFVLGPLLTRFHEAKVALPGGCAIGARPVDMHIYALKTLGAQIEIESGYINATAPQGLKGAEIKFRMVSVGATLNTLMAATLASGTTVIENAAREPEISDVASLLNSMGAVISGAGTGTITIQGVSALHGARHKVLPDRIEAGTYAIAAAITKGNIKLNSINPVLFESALSNLERAGSKIECGDYWVRISHSGDVYPVNFVTAPYPEFPTDLQAQFMALLTIAQGISEVKETIFENRFMHASGLTRLGAKINIEGETATITGVEVLQGAQVMATDLRAAASLILAALAAKGKSEITHVDYLYRGYEHLVEKLRACGANIERTIESVFLIPLLSTYFPDNAELGKGKSIAYIHNLIADYLDEPLPKQQSIVSI